MDFLGEFITKEPRRDRFLTFILNKTTYGINVDTVIEIIALKEIHKAQETPDYIRGILRIRGMAIPVMDLRRRFCIAPKADDEKTSIIIAELNEITLGLVVDCVTEVITVAGEDILKLPKIEADAISTGLKGIGKYDAGAVLLLDTDNLLEADALTALQAIL